MKHITLSLLAETVSNSKYLSFDSSAQAPLLCAFTNRSSQAFVRQELPMAVRLKEVFTSKQYMIRYIWHPSIRQIKLEPLRLLPPYWPPPLTALYILATDFHDMAVVSRATSNLTSFCSSSLGIKLKQPNTTRPSISTTIFVLTLLKHDSIC